MYNVCSSLYLSVCVLKDANPLFHGYLEGIPWNVIPGIKGVTSISLSLLSSHYSLTSTSPSSTVSYYQLIEYPRDR